MKLPLATEFSPSAKAQTTLELADGRPIDYAVQPPPNCRGDMVDDAICPRTACRYHLWQQDERPGRPHSPGARPPVKLRVVNGDQRPPESCMWREVKAHPEGMTADEVGLTLSGVVGERVLQVENRGLLKMKAIDHVCAVLEDGLAGMPRGTEVELVMPHNDHALPHQCFVTVAIRVREQTAKAGVRVRKRDHGKTRT